jgi:hypothetical protein
MKITLRLLAAVALLAGATAFAQDSATRPARGHRPAPHGNIDSDGSIILPDGTVLPPPQFNDDGSITLPDGSVLPAPETHVPPVKNSDGTITLPDGTVIPPNADGTYTLPNGRVLDLSKVPPTPPARRPGRGPRPSGG